MTSLGTIGAEQAAKLKTRPGRGRYIDVFCSGCDVPMYSMLPDQYYGNLDGTCGLCKQPPNPKPTGQMPSHDEILELAVANGFSDDDSGVGGDSNLDRSVCCGEYACGNDLIRFAHALLAKYGKQGA